MNYKYLLAGVSFAIASSGFAQPELFGPSDNVYSARDLGLTQEEMRSIVGSSRNDSRKIHALDVDRLTLQFLLSDLTSNLGSFLELVDSTSEEVNSIASILEVLSQEDRDRVVSAIKSMCTAYNSGADVTTSLKQYDIAIEASRASLYESAVQKLSAIRNIIDVERLSAFDEYYSFNRRMLEASSSTSFSENVLRLTGNNPIPTLDHHCRQ